MNDVNKNLGHATAYGYAKSKGYTGTEEEFAELMADYAAVGQRAEQAATAAAASATAASGSASDSAASATAAEGFAGNASTSAGNASQAAQNASQSASAASGSATAAGQSATAAAGSATTAGNKASEAAQSATQAAASATAAGTSATAAQAAQTAAETAQTAAEDAQAAAEAAAQTLVIDPTLTQPNQAAEAKATGDAISLVKSHLGVSTDNLVTLNASTTTNDVVFTDHGAKGMSITGTATSGGGRGRALTKSITLAPGTYYACVFADPSESAIPIFLIQTVVGIQIVLYLSYPNSVYTLTLDSETAVFVGANVAGGTTYNAAGVIIYISSVYPHITTAYSAKDFIARNDAEKTKYLTESSFYDLREVFPFTIGSYNSANDTVNFGTRTRLISFDKYTTHEPLKVSMPTGYRFGIVIYDGDSRIDSGWVTGEYVIPAGSTFFIQLAYSPDTTTPITDVKSSELYQNLTLVASEQYATKAELNELEAQVNKSPYDSVLPLSTEQLSVANPWSQGACLVGRKLVGFNASSNDHSTNGTARIYDADNNLTQIGSFAHNTGHASTADYCKRTDTMSVANGTYASGVIPTIYLVKNASAKIAAASNILITNPDVIAFDVSNLTGQGVGACFGETDQFMYVLTVENASQYDKYPTKYIYKLLMGKGSNDMTSLFASDNFGTFISGCGDNEYNGTAHLVASYSLEVYGELQGLKYRNGFLYMSCDSSKLTNVKTPYLAKMKLTADAAELVDFYHIPNYSDTGNLLTAESEGFVFDGAVGYVTVFPSGNSSRTLRFNAII